MKNIERPVVGLGVIIRGEDGQILVQKRKGSHAPYWSIPGGMLELGETFEGGGIREVREELGIRILRPRVIGVTNNLLTFRDEGIHSISIILLAENYEGTPTIMEPDKCEALQWTNPNSLPEPHFEASRWGVAAWLADRFSL